MASVLVAEDSRTQAMGIQFMLEEAGHTVTLAVDGAEALAPVGRHTPDIVLTDMHMPGKDGLQVTEEIRKTHQYVPVVLMTADGTEELAVEALRKGASNYIPKRLLERDLISTIDSIAAMIKARRTKNSVLNALTHAESTYTFGNDRQFAELLIAQFESELEQMAYDDGTGTFRIVTALKEAILNAIDHGNLELDSKMRDVGDGAEFYQLGIDRMREQPYCDRKVHVTARVSPEQLAYVIRDEGPGFDPSKLPDPSDPENLVKAHGRGIMLIRSFMDDVVFNEAGNQITLIKYRETPAAEVGDADSETLEQAKTLEILLVEDSMTNQVLGQSLLEREGHSVTIACNGVEAVEMSSGTRFDMILMDIEMPELDGLSATLKIRADESSSCAGVPIVAMTAHDAEEDIKRYRSAGMQAHIAKPLTAEKLQAIQDAFSPL